MGTIEPLNLRERLKDQTFRPVLKPDIPKLRKNIQSSFQTYELTDIGTRGFNLIREKESRKILLGVVLCSHDTSKCKNLQSHNVFY